MRFRVRRCRRDPCASAVTPDFSRRWEHWGDWGGRRSFGGWRQRGHGSSVLAGGLAESAFGAQRRSATELGAGRALAVVGMEGQGVTADGVLAGAVWLHVIALSDIRHVVKGIPPGAVGGAFSRPRVARGTGALARAMAGLAAQGSAGRGGGVRVDDQRCEGLAWCGHSPSSLRCWGSPTNQAGCRAVDLPPIAGHIRLKDFSEKPSLLRECPFSLYA